MRHRAVLAVLLALVFAGCGDVSPSPARSIVRTDAAPKAIGPYSQAVRVGDTLYCSGQIAIDPATSKMIDGDAAAQARRVLENLGAVLKAGGADFGDVVRATVYVSDMADYKAVNAVYAEYFSEAKPARAAVQVARLPLDAKVEISCIAVLSD